MKPTNKLFKNTCSFLVCIVQMSVSCTAGTQFSSHVSVSTPSRSFSHGVGDPLRMLASPRRHLKSSYRAVRRPENEQPEHFGYPRVKPSIPFLHEDIVRNNKFNAAPSQHNNYFDVAIPVLPPSPYKVDSPDPESLWPEGLFVPPRNPHFGTRRIGTDFMDPYLLEGSEAVAAVKRADHHGNYFFHDVPHLESLLANQDLRLKNNLKPHRFGSIRHMWPYNRL